jgi:hypothetical protein
MSTFVKGWKKVSALRISLPTLVLAAAVAAPVSAQSNLDFDVRGGLTVPAGNLNEVGAPGAGVGAGLGWWVHDRVALRVDGDLEVFGEDRLGDGVVMPRAFLWHYHAGLELEVLSGAESPWRVRLRGGAGGTTYDTENFQSRKADFFDSYFSASGGLLAGRRVGERLEVGLIGQAFFTFTDKDRTAELAAESPRILVPFSKASSFPVQLYLRWSLR